LKHGTVKIRLDAFGDNRGSMCKKDYVMMSFVVCTHQILG